jgi:hypothetical protein
MAEARQERRAPLSNACNGVRLGAFEHRFAVAASSRHDVPGLNWPV